MLVEKGERVGLWVLSYHNQPLLEVLFSSWKLVQTVELWITGCYSWSNRCRWCRCRHGVESTREKTIMSYLVSANTGISSRAWDSSWDKTPVLPIRRTNIPPPTHFILLFHFWDKKMKVLSCFIWFIDFILFVPCWILGNLFAIFLIHCLLF